MHWGVGQTATRAFKRKGNKNSVLFSTNRCRGGRERRRERGTGEEGRGRRRWEREGKEEGEGERDPALISNFAK